MKADCSPGHSRIYSRAHGAVFWPGMSRDIEHTRTKCADCWRMSPSQSSLPPHPPNVPTRPFQAIAADFGLLKGTGYLIIVDRFSGWPHIVASATGAKGFLSAVITYFSTFGVAEEISTDGGPEFTAKETEEFFKRWGVKHRLSSAYYPQSNGRAEVAVKSMKRLLTSHTDMYGSVDTEAVAAGLLQYRNTPDPETGVSPARVVFGRNLSDLLPVQPNSPVFQNPVVHPVWRDAWKNQEDALRLRFMKQTDRQQYSRQLPPLQPGDKVLLQNQTGPHSRRWDRTGVVVEAKPHDQYHVKVHGSGRLTLRNRKFLRQIKELSDTTTSATAPETYVRRPESMDGDRHQEERPTASNGVFPNPGAHPTSPLLNPEALQPMDNHASCTPPVESDAPSPSRQASPPPATSRPTQEQTPACLPARLCHKRTVSEPKLGGMWRKAYS